MGKKDMDYQIRELKRELKAANKEFRGLNILMKKLHKIAIEEEAGKLSIDTNNNGNLSIIN